MDIQTSGFGSSRSTLALEEGEDRPPVADDGETGSDGKFAKWVIVRVVSATNG